MYCSPAFLEWEMHLDSIKGSMLSTGREGILPVTESWWLLLYICQSNLWQPVTPCSWAARQKLYLGLLLQYSGREDVTI
jgi:hypothetical protein